MKAKPKRPAKKPAKRSGWGGKRKGAGGKKPRLPRRVEDYEALGPPPADELDIIRWAYQNLAVSMRHVATDQRLREESRRAELRSIAAKMGQLVPKARLRKAEKAVRDGVAQVEAPAGGKMEPAPALAKELRTLLKEGFEAATNSVAVPLMPPRSRGDGPK